MLLKEWLIKKGVTAYRFADRVGLSRSTVYMAINLQRRFSAKTAVDVENATDGDVTRQEALWPEYDWSKAPRIKKAPPTKVK